MFFANLKRNIEEIDYNELKEILRLNKDKDIVILDVRSMQEFCERHLNYAINIPLYELQNSVNKKITDKERIIIVYCQSGIRSKKAIRILYKNGYKNLYHLKGGLDEI